MANDSIKKFKKFQKWSFGTINIRTGAEKDDGAKIYSIAKELSKSDMTFLLLQEVRWRDNGNKLIQLDTGEKFEYHWCGFKKKREAGVGILIRVNNNIGIQNPSFNDPRIMGIDLKVYGLSIPVVNAYSPTESHGTDEQKRNFYAKLNKAITKSYKNQKFIIAGDFNATTSVANHKCNFDGKKL